MRKYDSKKSFAFKEQMRIGGAIAAALEPRMTQAAVAKKLGISQQMVDRVEKRALYRLAMLLRAKKEVVASREPVLKLA